MKSTTYLRAGAIVVIAATLILAAAAIAAQKKKVTTPEKKAKAAQIESGSGTAATNTSTSTDLLPTSPQAGEEINWDVLSSGGGPTTSTNFRLDGTLGQTVAGLSTSTNFMLNSGYWQDFGSGPAFVCGDVDGDGQVIITDAVFIVNYIFAGGSAPDPQESGDVDCDGQVIITDAVYIVNYIFAGGPVPCAGCPAT